MLDINKDKDFSLIKIFGKQLFEKWENTYPILKNKDVLAWIRDKIDKYTDEGKDASKFTITAYVKALQQYCDYYEVVNPSELLKEVKIDDRNFRVKKYLLYLLKYDKDDISELIELGFRKAPTSVTIRNSVQAKIKSFYTNRGLSISYNLKSAKGGANKDEITLTKDIIKKIHSKLESANYRLICKFETQTGLRINDVLKELTSGKYTIELYQDHYFVRNFRTQKETVIINFLFFTKELADLIQSISAIDDLINLDLSTLFLTRKGTRINKADYLSRLKAIISELGINGNIKTHALRKYYNSQLSKNRKLLDDDRILTHWEGREAPYTDQIYSRHIKDLDFYYTEWKKMETFICIDCIVYDNTSKEILKLKEDKVKLKEQIDSLLDDGLKMKRLLLELFVKTEGYDTLEDLEREEGKLENQEYTLSIVSEDDDINEALRKRKNENLQYLAKIKKDLE